MVRLKDVAAYCGVSVATVSKALADKGDIGEETKEKIRRACEEMGYLPNSSARALRLNRTYDLGVLLLNSDQSGLAHDYFSRIVESFRKQAEKAGYDITFISNGKADSMTFLERARYRGVDGVFIACADYGQPEILELIRSEIPVVVIDHSFENCSCVVSDNTRGMKELVHFVCDRGHEQIAYIYGNDTAVTRLRVAAFYEAMRERDLDVPDQFVRSGSYRNPQVCHSITKALLSVRNRPTCILYPDDFACVGGMNAIREMGFRIPEDVSIAGYDGIYFSQILKPKLTTVRQDTDAIGREAARKLIGHVENRKEEQVEEIVVGGRLIEGESVALL